MNEKFLDEWMVRARKILTLAEHPGTPEHEKKAAWNALFKLMDRYNFSILDCRESAKESEIVERMMHESGRLPYLKKLTFICLAEVFYCRVLTSRAYNKGPVTRVYVVGLPRNIELVSFFAATLPRAIKKAWDIAFANGPHASTRAAAKTKQTLWPSFYTGFLFGVVDAHKEQQQQPSDDPQNRSLVLVLNNQIDHWIKTNKPDIEDANTKVKSVYKGAFNAGVSCGLEHALTPPIEQEKNDIGSTLKFICARIT